MKRRKMHPIVKVITWLLIAVFIISGCSLDSESLVFFVTAFGSVFGLVVIAWIHGFFA